MPGLDFPGLKQYNYIGVITVLSALLMVSRLVWLQPDGADFIYLSNVLKDF